MEQGWKRKLHVVNYIAVWEDLKSIFSNIRDVVQTITQNADSIIALEDEYNDRLADLGIKALGVIEFDDVQGPTVKYVTGITGLVTKMLLDPNFTVRIHVAAQETTSLETEGGERLLLARFL